MSISSQVSRVTYTGTGSTNTYSYTFKIFDDDDLVVLVSNISTGAETTLTKTTDYTVTGVGETSGGTIVLVNSGQAWLSGANLANTHKIFIRRKPSIIQETDIRNQGAYFPESIEDQFDKQTFIDQAQQDEIDRSVKLPTSIIASTFNPTLPVDIAQASRAIVTNPGANGFAVGPTTSEISNAQSNALLAEDWATKTDGIVDATDYSSKAWAIGGTGVDDTLGRGSAKDWATLTSGTVDTADYSAKEYAIGTQGGAGGSAKSWATETGTDVDGVDYSSKEYAIGTQRRGLAGGGSAKDWANYVNGVNTVDDTEFSAKKYAQDAAQSAIDAAAAASASQWSDVVYVGFADSPVAVANTDGGKLYAVDCTGGNVVINLPSIATIDLSGAWSIGVKKTDSGSNTITVNPNGSETINGGANKIISRALAGSTFIPDADQTPDDWTSLTFGEVPIDGAIVGTTDTQDLSNKTFVDAITLTEIATPTTPSAGLKKFYAKTDGKIYTLNDLGEEVEVGSGGGSGGGKNYFDNPEFETNIDGVTTYDDGTYANGEGGSPSAITVAFNGTTPLAGEGDLEISKSAADGSGEGVTLTTRTIDRADRGENLVIQFEWDGTHANYASGDMKLYAYSTGTDATILPVYPIAGLNDDGTLPKQKTKIVAYVPTSSTTDSTVRVSLHVETTNATAYDVYVDSFKVGPDMVVPGAIVTGWQSFTPSYTNFGGGSVSSSYGYWRRVGDSMEIFSGFVKDGTPGSGTSAISFTLPNGETSDETKYQNGSVGSFTNVGSWRARLGGSGNNITEIVFSAGDTLNFREPAAGTNLTGADITASTTFAFHATVPIQGWSSGASLSTTEAAFTPWKMRASRTNTVTLTDNTWTKLPFSAPVVLDNISSYDSVNDYFVNRGKKRTVFFAAQINFVASASSRNVGARVYVNGANVTNSVTQPATATNSGSVPLFLGPYELNANDYVELYGYQNDVSGATTLDTTVYSLSIIEVPDFSTFSVFGKSEEFESNSSGLVTHSITAGQYGDFTSLLLGSGEYDVSAVGNWFSNGAVTTTTLYLGISTTSGNSATGLLRGDNLVSGTKTQTSSRHDSLAVTPYRITVTTPTTYYLKGRADTDITNLQVAYRLTARRIK